MIEQALQLSRIEFEVFLKKALLKHEIKPRKLSEAIEYSSLDGGKRFRPFLVKQVAELYHIASSIPYDAAVAIELIHCYSLVHDDLPCMDDDDLRRGRPTVHKKYDESTALLVGDILQSLAFEHLSGLDIDVAQRIQLCQGLSQACRHMVCGQMFDVQAQHEDSRAFDLKDIERIQKLKTGALIACSVYFGAVLGRASKGDIDNLYHWGLALGEAFQVTDDLLDYVGQEEKVGKKLHKDDGQGKVNFVTILGIEGAKKKLEDLTKTSDHYLSLCAIEADPLKDLWRWVTTREY